METIPDVLGPYHWKLNAQKAFAALYELKAMNKLEQQGIFESTYHLNITAAFLSISKLLLSHVSFLILQARIQNSPLQLHFPSSLIPTDNYGHMGKASCWKQWQ